MGKPLAAGDIAVELQIALMLLPFFFVAALLYSSVGHGGASAYLAVLALAGAYAGDTVPLVLMMNMLVASLALHAYWRAGHLTEADRPEEKEAHWSRRPGPRMLVPLLVASIPAAFVGGLLEVPQNTLTLVLAAAILAAGTRLLVLPVVVGPRGMLRPLPRPLWLLPLGALLGLLAGMTGIGGGIFLSPILLLARWAGPKRTSAVAAAFIFLNSAAGMAARVLAQPLPDPMVAAPILAVVGLGAVIGGRAGAFFVPGRSLNRILGVALLLASVRLILV
jgi:hypothetical protein